MKRFISRLAGALLALAIVYGVQAIFTHVVVPGQIKKLAGTYVTSEYVDAGSVEEMLTGFDFYPEEIAMADLTSLAAPRYVEFGEDKTYSFYYDADDFRSNVEAFFRQTYENMYTNRADLSEAYGEDFSAMSKTEFLDYYASLYSQESFDALITVLADDAYDYDYIAQDVETGTFTIEEDKILCTITGQTNAESMGYKLSGDELTLTFSNSVEKYTRCDP